jgi:hypothetical protein
MTLEIVILAWLICGLVVCGFALRTSIFSKTEPALSVFVFLALLLASPFIVLWFVAVSISLLARGRSPFVKRRAASPEQQLPEGRELLLCQMISLRRAHDKDLQRQPVPEHWPMFQLSRTPEETLLSAVEMFLWHLDDESSMEFANVTLTKPSDARRLLEPSLQQKIVDYAASAMRLRHDAYLSHGTELIREATEYASAWVLMSIARSYQTKTYPPRGWWNDRVDWREAKHGQLPQPFTGMPLDAIEEGTTRTAQDWRDLLSRAVDQDELYAFDSPSDYWQKLGGRAGLVLVRRGRPIANVTLKMN